MFIHIYINTPPYLCAKSKRPHSQFSDAVVLQKNALGFVGHASGHDGEVLRLAAHCHGGRVTHAPVRAVLRRHGFYHDQPDNQPERESA